MSFFTNRTQQMTLDDALFSLTARERKALENSWAKIFADELFPKIEEEPFRVLYCENNGRPNTPINVIVGASIIKELLDYSDDDIVEGLMLDVRLQYALHTTNFEEQPLSEKSLQNFRKKCYQYKQETGNDLMHTCIVSLSKEIARIMKISGRTRRMDSMMIDADIKKLSRLELIYSCMADLVIRLKRESVEGIPGSLLHYVADNDFNQVFYYARNTDYAGKCLQLLTDADVLSVFCGGRFEDWKEYRLFSRCISEQTVREGGSRRLATHEDMKKTEMESRHREGGNMELEQIYDDVKNTFAGLVEIDSPSLGEKDMAEHIRALFGGLGIELEEDDSAGVSGSNVGNLYAYVSGGGVGAPILLSAHMDTVMPAYGKKAVFGEDGLVRSDGTTVLGADDLAGVTAIYEAVKYLRGQNRVHRDIELLFTTGEEVFGKGAKAFDCGRLKAECAYVLDLCGRIGDAAYAAPSIFSFSACVKGKAAHAGFCSEEGVNAIAAAARAIAALPQGKLGEDTTANIGMISGGEGINIVSPTCTVKGEVRSLKHEQALAVLEEYRKAFEKAAAESGAGLEWTQVEDIRAYETDLESRVVSEYRKAAGKAGIEPRLVKTFGGSDHNVFAQYGIEGIILATSMNQVHTCEEYTNIHEIIKVTEVLIHLLSME